MLKSIISIHFSVFVYTRRKAAFSRAVMKITNINILAPALHLCYSTNKARSLQCRKLCVLKGYSAYRNHISARRIMMLNGPQTKGWTDSFTRSDVSQINYRLLAAVEKINSHPYLFQNSVFRTVFGET